MKNSSSFTCLFIALMLLAGSAAAQTDPRPGRLPVRLSTADSVVYRDFFRHREKAVFSRGNADFRLIASECDRLDFLMPAAGLQPNDSTRIFYDAANDRVEDIDFGYINENWVEQVRFFRTYDDAHQLTSSLAQNWTGSAWNNSSQYLYQLDAQGNIIELLYQAWIDEAWANGARELYTYTGNNLITSFIYQSWDPDLNEWSNNLQFLYDYGTDDLQDTRLVKVWLNGAWENSERYTYSYDGQGNELTALQESWDGASWIKENLETNSYNPDNLILTKILQLWNGTTWENTSRFAFTYDGNNQRVQFLYQGWNGVAWINSFKIDFEYDENGSQVAENQSNWTNGAWTLNSHCDYYYETFTGLPDPAVQEVALQVFPNPTTGLCTLKTAGPGAEQLVVHDLLGRAVFSHILLPEPQQQIDLSSLPRGIYVLQMLSTGGRQSVTRLVIDR